MNDKDRTLVMLSVGGICLTAVIAILAFTGHTTILGWVIGIALFLVLAYTAM